MARHKLAAGPGRPKGVTNRATREIKTFAEEFLTSPDYVASAKRRVKAGRAPHLEVLWHHYGFGKPKDTVSVELAPALLIVDELSAADVLEMKQAKDDA